MPITQVSISWLVLVLKHWSGSIQLAIAGSYTTAPHSNRGLGWNKTLVNNLGDFVSVFGVSNPKYFEEWKIFKIRKKISWFFYADPRYSTYILFRHVDVAAALPQGDRRRIVQDRSMVSELLMFPQWASLEGRVPRWSGRPGGDIRSVLTFCMLIVLDLS